MSVMSRTPSRRAVAGPRRIAELMILGIGLLAALVTMGGYTLVTNQLDQAGFTEIVAPLLLGTVGIAHMRSRPRRRTPGWWFLATGLVCLLGSQLLLFPIAFLFFVVAGLFALRPVSEGSL